MQIYVSDTHDAHVCHLWRENPNHSRDKEKKRREHVVRHICVSAALVYIGTLTTRQLISIAQWVTRASERASERQGKREECCCNAIATDVHSKR